MKQEDGYFSFFSLSSPTSTPSSSSSDSAKKNEELKNRVVYPEALHTLFELRKVADDEGRYLSSV